MPKKLILKHTLILISISVGQLFNPAYSANNGLDQTLNVNSKEAWQNNLENSDSQAYLSEFSNADVGSQTSTDTDNTLIWPVFPNESLNHIARMFYPKSATMQKIFVLKTLALNPNLPQSLTPETLFEKPSLLIVPSLKSLAIKTAAIKPDSVKKRDKSTFRISYNIQETFGDQARILIDSYEELINKNLYLKSQLTSLIEKIGYLETKLGELKLTFDKTLQISANDSALLDEFVNKRQVKTSLNNANNNIVPTNAEESSFFNKYGLTLAQILALVGLAFLVNHWIKKYRQREFERYLQLESTMFEKTLESKLNNYKPAALVDEAVVLSVTEPKSQTLENAISPDAQIILSSSLEEARLLVSINRNQDAIAHLKSTIKIYPKLSINHWLFLLEIFKKLDAKEDFENYAKQLHNTLNVMAPVWHESNPSIYVPQHLEEFVHIIENLQTIWPSTQAIDYLRNLITDNRDGDRVGFGKNVLCEILMLIELLDNR